MEEAEKESARSIWGGKEGASNLASLRARDLAWAKQQREDRLVRLTSSLSVC